MPTTRRIEDLYKRGRKASVTDGEDVVDVYIQKPNPLEKAAIARRAGAAKARYLLDADNEDSDEYLATYVSIRDYEDRDALITILLSDDIRRARYRAEAEVSADERWTTDELLQGLHDLWEGDAENRGLKWRFAEEPDDPEALKVFEQLKEFSEEVNKVFTSEKEHLRRQWDDVEDEAVFRRATQVMLKRQADEAFAKEYQQQTIFYATHYLVSTVDPDTAEEKHSAGERYFSTLDQVKMMDPAMHLELTIAIDLLEVPNTEIKDSPEESISSDSSETPETPEASPPSGPEAALL